MGRHGTCPGAAGTLLARGTECHFSKAVLWPTCRSTIPHSQLHCLEPSASRENKQAQQGASTCTWTSCWEPLQSDSPVALSSCPAPATFQNYLAHKAHSHFCTRPLSVQQTRERLYRGGWGAAGALQGQRCQCVPLFTSPPPSPSIGGQHFLSALTYQQGCWSVFLTHSPKPVWPWTKGASRINWSLLYALSLPPGATSPQ